jgi:hypothetical protein
VAADVSYSAKLCGTLSLLLKTIVTMAPAGTVIWLLPKAMFSALRSTVTDSGSGEGDGVGVGVGSGLGLGVGVGVGLGVATHAVRLVRAIAREMPIKMKLPRRRMFFMSILLNYYPNIL